MGNYGNICGIGAVYKSCFPAFILDEVHRLPHHRHRLAALHAINIVLIFGNKPQPRAVITLRSLAIRF
jgi:hypothetical protein